MLFKFAGPTPLCICFVLLIRDRDRHKKYKRAFGELTCNGGGLDDGDGGRLYNGDGLLDHWLLHGNLKRRELDRHLDCVVDLLILLSSCVAFTHLVRHRHPLISSIGHGLIGVLDRNRFHCNRFGGGCLVEEEFGPEEELGSFQIIFVLNMGHILL